MCSNKVKKYSTTPITIKKKNSRNGFNDYIFGRKTIIEPHCHNEILFG